MQCFTDMYFLNIPFTRYIRKACGLWFILENLKGNSNCAPFWLFTPSLDCLPSVRCYSVPHPQCCTPSCPRRLCACFSKHFGGTDTPECPNVVKRLRWKLFAVVGCSYIYRYSNCGHCKVQIHATLFNRQILPVLLHLQQKLPVLLRLQQKLPMLPLPLLHRQCHLMELLRLVPRSNTCWWR